MYNFTAICAYTPCSKPFPCPAWSPKIYCSPACYHAARSATVDTFADRFWSKVDKTPGHGPWGDCWLWQGASHANGYGNFRATPHKPGNVSAHIVCWFLTTGAWTEDGTFVLHRCDQPLCVNPGHLFTGTHQDNMDDMIAKGRQGHLRHPERVLRGDAHPARLHPERMARGERHGSRTHPERVPRGERSGKSKLTDAEAAEAVRLYATGQWTLAQLGARYGVAGETIRYRFKHQS